jgi:hypothetical protein
MGFVLAVDLTLFPIPIKGVYVKKSLCFLQKYMPLSCAGFEGNCDWREIAKIAD